MGCSASKGEQQSLLQIVGNPVTDSEQSHGATAAAFVANGSVPEALLLQQATAAKAALGPLLLASVKCGASIDAARSAGGAQGLASRHAFHLVQLEKERVAIMRQVDEARARLNGLRLNAALRVGRDVSSAAGQYERALEVAARTNGSARAPFVSAAERLHNTGELADGALVLVPRHGEMHRAKVLRRSLPAAGADDDGGDDGAVFYELSIWRIVSNQEETYEQGYETRLPIVERFPRARIYATGEKQAQVVRSITCSASPTDVGFLLGLLADAEASNLMLHELGPRIAAAVNGKLGRDAARAMAATLKATARVMEKASEKYGGRFSHVCDLARMTFVVTDFEAATLVLEALYACEELDVILMKNRLMPEFDASETGGYRDMLLNCRDRANGHIVEIQITLEGLLAVKTGCGHTQYKLVRVLELNDPGVTKLVGDLTPASIEEIRCGLIKTVKSGSGLAAHFDLLVAALAAPTCFVTELDLNNNTFPPGKRLDDVLTPEVLNQLQPHLRVLYMGDTGATGEIPEALFGCRRLAKFGISRTDVSGAISASLGNLVHLTGWYTWNTQMHGPIPEAVTRLPELYNFYAHAPHYTRKGKELLPPTPESFKCMEGVWSVGEATFDDAAAAFTAYTTEIGR
jgi:hypothetical protein